MKATGIIMQATIRELGRQPAVWSVLGLAGLAVGGGGMWRDFNFGDDETRFVLNFGWGMQGLVGTVFAVVAGAQTLTREFEQGTAQLMRARAVSPGAIVVGKAAGVWLVSAAFIVGSTLWLLAVAGMGNGGVPGVWVLETVGVSLAKLAVVVSLAAWFASYGRSVLFVVLASGGVLVLGHLHPLIAADDGWGRGLAIMVPDLSWFQAGSGSAGNEHPVGPWLSVAQKWTYALGYGAVFLLLGTLAWRRRES